MLALYLFDEGAGTTVHDVSDAGAPLDLIIPDEGAVTWLAGGGLQVDSQSLIASAGPASKVTNGMQATGELTVEAWVAPGNLTQNGPARIVTLSQDSSNRNFSLVQGRYRRSSELYAMRLRTTTTDDNGTPALETDAGTLTTALTHVVFTREVDGTRSFYLDGVQVESESGGGTLANWDASHRLALAREFDGTSQVWLGTYQQVALYDRPLDAAEVAARHAFGPLSNELPVASFTAIPDSGPVPLDVAFDASASLDPDGSIVSYDWDWGDGSGESSALPTANHTFVSAGSYTVRLTVTDELGGTASATQTVTLASVFTSDDFNAFNVDGSRWTIVDPIGDALVRTQGTNTSDAQLVIELPPGAHAIRTDSNESVRLMQPTLDQDLSIEVKFESLLDQRFQEQGLIVEATADHFVRADFYSDGADALLFVGVYDGGSLSVKANLPVTGASPQILRIVRVADDFEVLWSVDGISFFSAATFNEPMVVSAVGVFAANEGPSPAQTTLVDYFFNAATPIVPEDGATDVVDEVGPLHYNIAATAGQSGALLDWSTDELAQATVRYGKTLAYEAGSVVEPDFDTVHSLILGDLEADSIYHVLIESLDASGNLGVSEDFTFQTLPAAAGGELPFIDLWYGDTQPAAAFGAPQPAFNLVGNVSDPDGIASLTYSLNGGSASPLSIGPDSFRLQEMGDFNAEIAYAELQPGPNQVVVTATDTLGNSSLEFVTVDHLAGTTSLPLTVDWSAGIQHQAQVVDGHWSVGAQGLQTAEVGFDRIVALGSGALADVEVEVPVTVYGLDSRGYLPPANNPGIGVGLRWVGHTQVGSEQPARGYVPLGGLVLNLWFDPLNPADQRLRILDNDGNQVAQVNSNLALGTTYRVKMRASTVLGETQYQFKVWEEGSAEPGSWTLEATDAAVQGTGSVILLAHYADAVFGNAEVRAPPPPSPPIIDVQPQDQVVLAPAVGSFGVSASGTAPLSYQWQEFDGATFVDIAGATAPTFDTPPTAFPGDYGRSFRVVVTNPLGSETSAVATLEVFESLPRVSEGLLALYDFREGAGTIVGDHSGFGTPLDLEIPDPLAVTWEPGGGLTLDSESLVASATAASKITDAILLSNEVTLEAWVAPATPNQNGPARIVTLSEDSSRRNITLGQGQSGGASDLYMTRLRTTETNDNGIPPLETAAGSLVPTLTHVVFTRDAAGATRLYLDGVESAAGSAGGSLANWDASYRLALGREFDGTSQVFLGTYHLVAIYEGALSAAQVSQNYAIGPAGNASPVALFSASPDVADPPVLVGFDASASFDPDGTIVSYTWDYGDGTVETLPGPTTTHDYTERGIYRVELTVEDELGVRVSAVHVLEFDDVFVSDDFNRFNLDAELWDFIDPLGDSRFWNQGVNTPDARLYLQVPAGTAHAITRTANDAARIMQPVVDRDFVIDVKFESEVTQQYQQQGLLIEESDSHFIRAEFYSDGTVTRIFVGVYDEGGLSTLTNQVIAGGAPRFMRIARNGDLFEVSYSEDGLGFATVASFAESMTTTAVGVFAGNDGPAPEFTAIIDYFITSWDPIADDAATDVVDDTPPFLYNVQASATPDSITLQWVTDEPATGAADIGEDPTYALGSFVEPGGTSLVHSLQIGGLENGIDYHLRLRSMDASGNEGATADFVVTTGTGAPVSNLISDDFNDFSLDPSIWSVFDPVGDVSFTTRGTNTADAQLLIHLPPGAHAISGSANEAARIMQPLVDGDFEVEVKFESSLTSQFQEQGLLVEATSSHFVRADLYSNGATNRIFVGVYNGGSLAAKADLGIPTGNPQWLRILREGDLFQVSYSLNGIVFQPVVDFSEPMVASAVGVFAANEGPSPEHIAIVDYFFNNADPIVPEDGDTGVVDETPPLLYNISTIPASDSILVSWSTDELATGAVDVGLDPSYGLGVFDEIAAPGASHSVQVTGLDPDTEYHLRIRSSDLSGNESQSANLVQRTTVSGGGGDGPIIDVWYGLYQPAGQNGEPQEFFNLVGNVFDPQGVAALSYTLNGGSTSPLSFEADTRRLQNEGDFNAEIPYSALAEGLNFIVLTATDTSANQSFETIAIDRSFGARALPYTIDWSLAPSIQEVAQIVDGKWSIVPGGLQTTEIGYDRIAAVGDLDMSDVEVTVPFTVYSIDGRGFLSPANHPVVGVGLRWLGHSVKNSEQPGIEFTPLGGLIVNSWNDPGDLSDQRLRVLGNNGQGIGQLTTSLSLGVTYVLKVRCETNGGTTDYFAKIWPQGSPEPSSWTLETSESGVHSRGSIILVAQYADTIFGDVEVKDVSGAPTGPSILAQPSDLLVLAPGSANFSVLADGTPPLLYQWQEFDGASFVDLPGETGESLSLSSTVYPDDDGRQFRVVVDNGLGTAISEAAALTVVETASRATADLQALYLFDEGAGSTLVRDQSGVGAPVDLEIPNLASVAWEPGGGLTLVAESLVASPGPADKISNAVIASNELTLEAWIEPGNLTQNGPARIVTLSSNSSRRNVTLGQGHFGGSSALYAARLRSTGTNNNGTPALETSAGSLTTDLTHVVFTRDVSGETRIYLDGVPVQIGANTGDLSTWDPSYRLALGREFDGTSQVFLGTYHLVAFYSRALTPFEISSNFAAGPGGTPPPPSPPEIFEDPQDTQTFDGTSATLSVVATGNPQPTFQWEEFDGVAFVEIPGATGPSYTTPALFLADDGAEFRVVVSNVNGSVTSAPALVSVQPAPPRVGAGLVALYLFNDGAGTTVRDVSGFGTPLDLVIPDLGAVVWEPGGGLTLASASLVASPGPADKISNAIASSGEFTLEAWVAPANLTQNGPARIVTLSTDSSNRNVTLAQGRHKKSAERYAVRLRTTTTNDNGTPAVESAVGTLTTALTHVVFTRDASGNARIYLDGVEVESDTRGGTLVNWDASYRLAIGREFDGTSQVFLGTYRLVAFYDRALSAGEVLQNHGVGPIGAGAP